MSKLSGSIVKTTIHKLRDIEINLKAIPFGRVVEITKEFADLNLKPEHEQIEYMKQILLDYTDLEIDDLGSYDYSITVEEAQDIFNKLMAVNKNPKVHGQSRK